MNYRIGYIGFGGMAGGYHYDTAMREDVPFTPAAVYDVNPDRRAYAESKGLKAFDNIGVASIRPRTRRDTQPIPLPICLRGTGGRIPRDE